MYYVYVVENRKGQCYKGYTSNLTRRRVAHLLQWSLYSRKSGSCHLVYFEIYVHKTDAIKRENFLKTGQGRLFLRQKLGRVAKPRGEPISATYMERYSAQGGLKGTVYHTERYPSG